MIGFANRMKLGRFYKKQVGCVYHRAIYFCCKTYQIHVLDGHFGLHKYFNRTICLVFL